jgi:ubiquinone/menaquinone biosynthesis C-methylase UbiE
MTVMDFGCGPGFFTLDMARLVGDAGSVIATDLQSGMLEKLGNKFRGTGLENRVTLHQCETGSINFAQPIDLFFSFYVLHEVPDQNAILQEISNMLNPGGFVFLAEPPVHVSRKQFAATVAAAERNGLRLREKPKVFFSKTALLIKDT